MTTGGTNARSLGSGWQMTKTKTKKKKWAKFSRHGVVTLKLKNYSQRYHVLRLHIVNSVSIRLKRKRKKDSLTKSTTT